MTTWLRVKRAARRADAEMPVWGWLGILFAVAALLATLAGYAG